MGFRIVLVLNNDYAHQWQHDTQLGQKIWGAAAVHSYGDRGAGMANPLPYGSIIEQTHADTQTLAIIDGCSGKALAWEQWHFGQKPEDRDLALLKQLADKMGYRISKKPVTSWPAPTATLLNPNE